MASRPEATGRGPFQAHHLRPGDRYELSQGHAIYCAPTGGDGARATVTGSLVIDTDPDVDGAAIDAGFTSSDGTLRAPDIAVGVPNKPGWVRGTPPLAIEYASVGQEEEPLQRKIDDLLEAGTRWVWVVRLIGPRRVEVYERGQPMRVLGAGDALLAPGVLRKPVPVEALYDREVAHERALENLLERLGYHSLDDVREEGREEGREAGERAERLATVLEILSERFGALPDSVQAALAQTDLAALRALSRRALRAATLEEVFATQ